jgi:hypothetical protein
MKRYLIEMMMGMSSYIALQSLDSCGADFSIAFDGVVFRSRNNLSVIDVQDQQSW